MRWREVINSCLSPGPMFEEIDGLGQDHLRADKVHTAEAFLLAGFLLAWSATDLGPDGALAIKEGIRPGGVCGAENSNHGDRKGCSDVPGSGVIADHQTASADQGLQLADGDIVLGQVEGLGLEGGLQVGGYIGLFGAGGNNKLQTKAFGQGIGDLSVLLGGPALRRTETSSGMH